MNKTEQYMDQLSNVLFRVLSLISKNLDFHILNNDGIIIKSGDQTLLKIRKDRIETLDPNTPSIFFDQKSKLSDAFIDLKLLEDFLIFLNKNSTPIFFNHIGFCYQVTSKKIERDRLKKLAHEKKLNIYEIPSNDASLWLFIGDKNNMNIPLLEFLPVEKADDYYKDYWMPHIHIDLHTRLTVDQIKYSTHTIFQGIKTANPSVVINGVIYQTRIWLGVISGVNICLDLGTNKTNSLYQRRYLLKAI